MLGAIAGDIIGSVYEWHNIKTKEFPLISPKCFFTDDSVLTIALADTILTGTPYVRNLHAFYHDYPHCSYGGGFHHWVQSGNGMPYQSWGNGAAMRISPAGWAYETLATVLERAAEFTGVTHNHPEGIKGGQATAAAIFLARKGKSKEEIRGYIGSQFGYDLSRHVDAIRPTYTFNESCQETVPQAICAFLDGNDFEDAIRNAISLGGDSDTLACITGGIAEAFWGGVPQPIVSKVYQVLDKRLGAITREFTKAHC